MFSPEKQLKEIILSEIKAESVSISGLVRRLKGRGISIHRLVLTGYLRALTDMGLIREKEIPPSKIYVVLPNRDETIYSAVAEGCRKCGFSDALSSTVAVYTLQHLFRRPVFRRELEQMGLPHAPGLKEAPQQLVAESRRLLMRAGYRIPESEPAFLAEMDHQKEMNRLLLQITADGFRISHLELDTKQLTLQ